MSVNNKESDLFPYLHENNLKELRKAVKHIKKGVWLHGDGNMYPKESDSNDRLKFRNMDQDHPATFGGGYRKFFDFDTTLPKSLKELEGMLVEAMNEEKTAAANSQNLRTSSNPNALPAYDIDDTEESTTGSEGGEPGTEGEGDPGADTGADTGKKSSKKK